MKSNVTAREEEERRFPGRYIDSFKSPDRHVLRSSREILDAFRVHFRVHFHDRFARFMISRFRSFAAILMTSLALEWAKRLAARVWLLNAKSVMR